MKPGSKFTARQSRTDEVETFVVVSVAMNGAVEAASPQRIVRFRRDHEGRLSEVAPIQHRVNFGAWVETGE